MLSIRISVFSNQVTVSDGKPLYRRLIEWSEDIQFPYDRMYASMCVLYPRSYVIFEVTGV